MLFRETVLVEISETASRVNSQLITRARTRREESGALSIQQKFRFEISGTSRAQWNGTFRLHRPDPSHRAFCYCGLAADSKLHSKREE